MVFNDAPNLHILYDLVHSSFRMWQSPGNYWISNENNEGKFLYFGW